MSARCSKGPRAGNLRSDVNSFLTASSKNTLHRSSFYATLFNSRREMGNVELPSPGVQKLLGLFGKYVTEESRRKGLQFKPKSTDVILCTAPKSGTTWAQQICHGLRSGGDMDFEEIGLVVPCLEMAHDYGYEHLQKPQPFAPRMYKCHHAHQPCPKGAGKYIIVIR